jgi:hypothetical protein
MKKFLVVALVIALAPLASLAQPQLKVLDGLSFDLGKVGRGSVSTKRLILKNAGSDTLKIGQVEVSCGCTGTVVSNKNLAGGDTTSLLITFNSKNFSGPVHKSVTINSNSVGMPKTIVEFTANVTEDMSFSSMQFYYKDAEVGRKAYTTVTVKNTSENDLLITGYRTKLEGFLLKYPKSKIAPGESADLIGEYTPAKALPVLSDGVTITTSSAAQPEIYLYIFGTVKEFKFQ